MSVSKTDETTQIKIRDARRENDIKSIAFAMQMYYDGYNRYLSSSDVPALIGDFLKILPKDPLTDQGYFWLDNTGKTNNYCIWAKLESGNYFAASEKGTKKLASVPTQHPCLSEAETKSITVLSPNGGETYVKGQVYKIGWNVANGVNRVMIGLQGPSSRTILASTSASTGFYSWTVPTDIVASSTYKILIGDIDSSVNDQSDGYFSIATTVAPSIAVTYPTAGETLQKGTDTFINLQFSPSVPKGGFVVNLLRSDADIAVAHLKYCGTTGYAQDSATPINVSWAWRVGYDADGKEIADGSYRIFIYDCGNKTDPVWTGSTASAKSNIFSIVSAVAAPSITVLSPNGGETWTRGQTYTITWKASGVDTVLIELDNGSEGWHLAYYVKASLGKHSWTIPLTQMPGSNYRIKVIGQGNAAGTEDASDGYFSIADKPSITSFNYTETDAYGGSVKFSWIGTGADGVRFVMPCLSGLSIKYADTGADFFCGESDRMFLINNTVYLKFTNTSSSLINITATLTPVISSANYTAYSKSVNFSIIAAPSVTVTSPNGGEKWTVKNTYDIKWMAAGVEKVIIYLYDYAGTVGTRALVYNVPASDGKYSWTISSEIAPSDMLKIAVRDSLAQQQTYDLSDNYFSIISATTTTSTSTALIGGEDQLASISTAVSKLMAEVNKLLGK